MSFIKRVENQNDIKVKQLRTDNGTEFKNSIIVNFCDEKGILHNFSSPYTPEQNGVTERKNKTLIEATRIMLSGSVFSKQYRTEPVATACYTQNRPTIIKRYLKTHYEIFCGRLLNINFFHVFGFLVFIHNHKDQLGKFDEKDDDGYFLGYSLVSKSFRFIEPYEKPEPIVTEADASLDQNDQANQCDQNDLNDQIDHYLQTDKILNDDQPEHSNQNNDEHIIDNLPNTNDVQITEPPSYSTKDASVPIAVSTIQTESHHLSHPQPLQLLKTDGLGKNILS
ncbi:retrovirus-related pol polyprotein from transposon TNT 1-94 [Tanacetum coccineum]